MNSDLRCPICGGPLSDDVLGGNCPRCLLDRRLNPKFPDPEGLKHPGRIGPYHILNLLGEGGMGIVYLAEQREPLRRRVALKLMKHGLDSRQVVARFESERQALALMNHPGVAKVLDAGLSEDGRPYFVMEYVPGLPITEFCDRRELSLQERLKLFTQVCDAIQHAHQKGLIHRDIKPSNVIVTEQDATAVAKVIDFGVAKATNQPLSARTMFTEHGVMVGTPAYMSPEQAEASVWEVDTRSDIYSLGVLLYELLVGSLPLEIGTVKQEAIAELLRRIREEDPPKPTTRIERLGDAAKDVARRRRTDARSLRHQLKGDLDWITMRALEKNPKRRYASVSELGADIHRHLASEPVAAGPPSFSYRVQKLARRHRVETLAILSVALTLGIGVAVSAGFYLRAENERRRTKLDADAFEAALRNEPQRYVQLANRAIAEHRSSLGPDSLDLARHLVTQLTVSWDLPVIQADRQAWEEEALRITDGSLAKGDASAVDVFLNLSDSTSNQSAINDLSIKALALLQRNRIGLRQDDASRLADLLERGDYRKDDVQAESVARQIVQLRRETGPGSPKLRSSIENFADVLVLKASAQRRHGELFAACTAFREARSLLQETQGVEGAYTRVRLRELEAEFSACTAGTQEVTLRQIYEDLQKTEGAGNSATQTVLNRLIDFYKSTRSREANLPRPAISLKDVWDIGPIRFESGARHYSYAISVPLNQQSMWLMRVRNTTVVGTLRVDSIRSRPPVIREADSSSAKEDLVPLSSTETTYNEQHTGFSCTLDCGSHWILIPQTVVADPARERALVFYSKTLRSLSGGTPAMEQKAGVSLAVWKGVEKSAERPEVAPNTQEPTLLFGPNEPAWGTAAFSMDGLLYAYGCEPKDDKLRMSCLLARVPLDRSLERSDWRFYDGKGWTQDWREAATVVELSSVALFGVHWNQYLGKFVAVSTRALSHQIQLRLSERPEGPWSQPVVAVESLRPSIGLPFPWNGISTVHPELSEENGRVEYLTYSRASGVGTEIRMVRIEFTK